MRIGEVRFIAAKLGLLLFLASGAGLHAQTLDKMKDKVEEKALANGMKFIVMERHEAPVVSCHVYADVGSAQEVYGITGISHILEHMAFKGTRTVGTKDWPAESRVLDELDTAYARLEKEKRRPETDAGRIKALQDEFDRLQSKAKEYVINNEYFDMLLRQGDIGAGAYTNFDATQYVDSLPSNKLEFWMAMASDRFLNPVFREFYKERDVIMEERRLVVETQPVMKLLEDFFAVAYKVHPYHHFVTGNMSDLEQIDHQDVKDYFKKYYSPSNLTAAVVGDVKAAEVFAMAELYFGRIPSGPRPEPLRSREPGQWGERRVEVVAQSQPILLVGYHRPEGAHPDDGPLKALANILSEGRSSRLWEVLVKKEQAAAACQNVSGLPGAKYPNIIGFLSVPSKDRTAAESLKLIDQEIEKIKKERVGGQELSKYKQSAKKQLIDQMKDNNQMAGLLTAYDVIKGGWRRLFEELDRIDRITADDIQRVAKTYLIRTNRTIGEIIPEKS